MFASPGWSHSGLGSASIQPTTWPLTSMHAVGEGSAEPGPSHRSHSSSRWSTTRSRSSMANVRTVTTPSLAGSTTAPAWPTRRRSGLNCEAAGHLQRLCVPALELGQHPLREQSHAALGEVVGHAAVAEPGQQATHVDHRPHVLELGEDLVGGTPWHEVDEVVDRPLRTVSLHVARDAGVELVALHALVRGGRELVVAHHRRVVLADPLAGHLLGPVGALVAEDEAARDRPRRVAAVDLPVHALVDRDVLLDGRP